LAAEIQSVLCVSDDSNDIVSPAPTPVRENRYKTSKLISISEETHLNQKKSSHAISNFRNISMSLPDHIDPPRSNWLIVNPFTSNSQTLSSLNQEDEPRINSSPILFAHLYSDYN
jgi:hypothetical protein